MNSMEDGKRSAEINASNTEENKFEPIMCKKITLEDSSLPEANPNSTYSKLPIEEFAKKALFGMGWKEGQGIGRNKSNCLSKPIEYKPRPTGMGLGAIPKIDIIKMIKDGKVVTNEDLVSKGRKTKYIIGDSNENIDEDQVEFGDLVSITTGKYQNLSGLLKDISEDKKTATIELSINQKNIKVKLKNLAKQKKDINKKVKNLKNIEKNKRKKRKKLNWILPDIKLRIVSKKYKNGAFFQTKGRVTDIISISKFSFYTDTGKILEDLKESQVETVMPSIKGKVKILKGENKGNIGILINRDKKANKVQIQLTDNFQILQMTQDDCSAI